MFTCSCFAGHYGGERSTSHSLRLCLLLPDSLLLLTSSLSLLINSLSPLTKSSPFTLTRETALITQHIVKGPPLSLTTTPSRLPKPVISGSMFCSRSWVGPSLTALQRRSRPFLLPQRSARAVMKTAARTFHQGQEISLQDGVQV